MKKLIVSLLVAALIGVGFQQYQARAQAAPAMFVLACGIAAGCLILYVYVRAGEVKKRCIVLQKSHYDGNWQCVATNVMVIPSNLSKAFPAFSDQMVDSMACYRVIEIPMPQNFNVQFNPLSTAQPFIY